MRSDAQAEEAEVLARILGGHLQLQRLHERETRRRGGVEGGKDLGSAY